MKTTLRLLLLASLFAISCKKDDSVDSITQTPGPLIKKVTIHNAEDDTVVLNFHYRADSTVDTFRSTINGAIWMERLFTHGQNFISWRSLNTPTIYTDTMWLDAQGRIMLAENRRFVYNAAGQLVHTVQDPPGVDPDTVTHLWSGGNMTQSVSEDGTTVTFTYDVNKPFMRGDPRHIHALAQFGRNTTFGANLLASTSPSAGGLSEQCTYQFDSLGRIAQSHFTSVPPNTTMFIEYY